MSSYELRKRVVQRETTYGEGGLSASMPVARVAGLGVIANPFAGAVVQDLSRLFDVGFNLAEDLMSEMVPLLARPACSYGKAAIVGTRGDLEHAHALLHPKLGKAMREPIGGGQALIPSAAKVGAAGTSIDMPLGHKDDAWSFDHFDAMTVSLSDAPRPDEILLAIAIADGGRPSSRIGKARASE